MRRLSALLLLTFAPLGASWQVDRHPVANVRITSLFGESRGDHFHAGIDYAGVQPVVAVAAGEVVFSRDSDRDPLRPVFGVGNFIAVDHGEGVRSYYYHLAPGSVSRTADRVTAGTPLATMGDSGRSTAEHLHFMVEDRKAQRILNPLAVLPSTPDARKPEVSSFLVMGRDGKAIPLRDGRAVYTKGDVRFFAIAWDLRFDMMGDWRRRPNAYNGAGVRRLVFRADERLQRAYDFSYLKKSEKGLVLEGGFSHDEVFGLPWNYRLGSFLPTQAMHSFEITAEDWAGNTDTLLCRIFFR